VNRKREEPTPLRSGKNLEPRNGKRITLKAVASFVGLSPGTVSSVLNNSPASSCVPQRTKDRIFAAARELDYRPHFFARSLRVQRTYTVGVICQETGDSYSASVTSGIERYLRDRGFLFWTVAHRNDPELLQSYSRLLLERGIEGFITLDTALPEAPQLPTVAVAGHKVLPKVTNLILDHDAGAELALKHLYDLGHRQIAYLRGPKTSADSEDRWKSTLRSAKALRLEVDPDLVVQMEGWVGSPEAGYPATREILSRGNRFTALFAYNDFSAIGAISALNEAGVRVPHDISVVGFDDIAIAQYVNPRLTTIRQPLRSMGELAARTLLDRIEGGEFVPEILVEPELVVRQSTCPVINS
jgi:DNA-binding LacI/PurR family transcriptional regulator